MLNRIAPRERSSINWPISYPCRARSSSSDRIINSALPFFNSRSGTGDAIYCNAIYAHWNWCQLRTSRCLEHRVPNLADHSVSADASACRGLPTLPARRCFGVQRTARRTQPPLLWCVLTCRDPSCLLVRNRGAGWAGKMDDFEALEAGFATPFFEIGGGIIERVAEFNQHVQRHEQIKKILSERIVDQRLESKERTVR